MDLMELIRKAASGGELDEREIEFVKSCRPGGGSGELEARNAELAERLKLLEAQLAETENRSLPEQERLKRKFETELAALRKQAETAGSERDAARQELNRLRFRSQVDRLAEKHNFADRDYLEYLCGKSGIEPDSGEAADAFMKELREQSPRFFKLDLTPGPGVPAHTR
ncbi:hypothetical protein [Victivallis vadensis]|uniref:phage scaffolding protein n=1 Tax=Victivallis vadensis TaxID=172901 RepID=UPI003AF60A86